jgi:hypothetical protein
MIRRRRCFRLCDVRLLTLSNLLQLVQLLFHVSVLSAPAASHYGIIPSNTSSYAIAFHALCFLLLAIIRLIPYNIFWLRRYAIAVCSATAASHYGIIPASVNYATVVLCALSSVHIYPASLFRITLQSFFLYLMHNYLISSGWYAYLIPSELYTYLVSSNWYTYLISSSIFHALCFLLLAFTRLIPYNIYVIAVCSATAASHYGIIPASVNYATVVLCALASVHISPLRYLFLLYLMYNYFIPSGWY